MPTKSEKTHMGRVAELGCIVCRNQGYGHTPREMTAIHHVRAGQGMGKRASNFDVLPLCARHHQTGGYGVAFHAGRREWERRYGSEVDLLAQIMGLLDGKE